MLNQNASARRVAPRVALALALIGAASLPILDRPAAASAVAVEPVAVAPETIAGLPAATTTTVTSVYDVASWDEATIGGVNPDVLALALKAAAAAERRGDVTAPKTLTVIDFSKASTAERLWVYDLTTRTLLFEEVVSHGRGSGFAMATQFSNVPESNRSSLGLYRTAETYIGKHGYSLRLDGLDAGYNDKARERAIVMHAADYVNPAVAKANGYLGRSLGCPALRPQISRQLIDTVKQGGLLFAYYPDTTWLNGSSYLN